MDDLLTEARLASAAKQHVERMLPYFENLHEHVMRRAPIVRTNSKEGAFEDMMRIASNCENKWDSACKLHAAACFAEAAFLAWVCIEETGRLSYARYEAALVEAGKYPDSTEKRDENRDLRSHRKKHYIAACAALVINARADRLIGMERLNALIESAKNGTAEARRQACLYCDTSENGIAQPSAEVLGPEATELIAIAGECLVEVGGVTPPEFERLNAKVDAWRRAIKLCTTRAGAND